VTPDTRNRRERLALLLVLLVACAGLKLAFNPGLGRNSLDGDYYFQVARHVMEGDGLETSVSLYHQGLKELPAPTNVYPLWPLLLGYAGRLIGLFQAAVLLPEILFLADLVLLYFLALRLAAAWGAPATLLAGGASLDFGHLAVALFATNHVFFQFTSLPYTEALAFGLAFAALIELDRAVERGGGWRFAASGLLAAAAFDTRSQMVMLIPAMVGALVVAGLRRRHYLRAAGIVLGSAVAGFLPWLIYVATFVKPFTLKALLSIGAFRQTPEIAPFNWGVPTASVAQYWLNRLSGLGVAFDPRSSQSYVASFGLVALLVPAALLLFAARLPRRGLHARSWTRPRQILPLATLAAGLAMVAPIHVLHSRMLWEWRFGFRHGLPFLLLLLPALAYSMRQDLLRRLALGLALLTLGMACLNLGLLLGTDFPSGLQGAEPELVAWLDEQPRPPTVITTQAQTLAVYSRAGFHWMECREDSVKVRQLLALTGAEYVLVYPNELRCPFVQGLQDLEVARSFGDGATKLWLLRPPSGLTPDRRSTTPPAPTAPG